jgi:hypothetical protein
LSKSGSREADADAAGGEASQRTEEGARRPPRRGEVVEEEAAAERSADRSCVVMVAIAAVEEAGRVELSCGEERSGRTTPSARDWERNGDRWAAFGMGIYTSLVITLSLDLVFCPVEISTKYPRIREYHKQDENVYSFSPKKIFWVKC